MMSTRQKCPRCNKYTVDYDAYRRVNKCLVDICGCVVIDEDTYAYLKIDLSTKTINEVKVAKGTETSIINKYHLL